MKKSNAGFALVVALLAMTLAAAAGAAPQSVGKRGLSAKLRLVAILAEQKLDQLRDADFDSLSNSPDAALQHDVDGFVDYMDARGVLVGEGSIPPLSMAFTRRWSIAPQPGNLANGMVIYVLVLSRETLKSLPASSARMTMVRTRAGRIGA